jgi:pilus assembly protein Flp/PilA
MEEIKVEAAKQEEEQEGATMIEYALLVALIAIIALAAIRYLGNNVSKQFSNVSSIIRS